jgi:divalent metal cation (Fe/Co/Zn/Cd) transporter
MRRYHVLALALAIGLLMPTFALALNLPGQIVTCSGATDAAGMHACTCQDLIKTAQNVLYTGIYVAVFMSAVLFAWAGWKLLTGKSTGTSADIESGKKILWNVIVGLVIILAAWLVVNTLFTALTNSRGIGSFCP